MQLITLCKFDELILLIVDLFIHNVPVELIDAEKTITITITITTTITITITTIITTTTITIAITIFIPLNNRLIN